MAGICPGSGSPHDIDIISDRRSSHCSSQSDIDDEDVELEVAFTLTVYRNGQPVELSFYHDDATIQDLSDTVAEELHIPAAGQKFLITPKTGLLKPPFKDSHLSLKSIQEKKIVLMSTTIA